MATGYKPIKLRVFGVIVLVILMSISTAGVQGDDMKWFPESTLYQQAQPAPFLNPPYYGTVQVNCVYDHQYPIYRDESASVNSTVIHYDGTSWPGTVNSCTIGTPSCYSGHNGIDYNLKYDLVRAAASGDVQYAGWRYPANHQAGEGLYVRIHHNNDYHTIYGHMSVLRVRTGDQSICETGEFSCILGISGNTGNSTGPHLHFELEPPNDNRSANPYGWIDENHNDPWEDWSGLASHDVWLRYPSITNSDVYPSGAPLTAPPINENEPGAFTLDDGDTGFVENPAGCWTVDNTAGWNNAYRRRTIPGGNCTATWNFAQTRLAGRYNVFVHVPNDNVAPDDRRATVDAVRYTIRHTVSPSQSWNKQTQLVVVNQWAYPNNAHTSRWVYLGAYYFNTNQYGMDYVRLESDTLDSRAGVIAADAVRFAPVRYRTYLPLVLKCYPAILPTAPALNTISNPAPSPNYTVSWQPASGAATYTLQEATHPNFTGAVTVYAGASTAWTAANKPIGTYYYRVRATNCAGNSGWSSTRSTTVPPSGWVTLTSQNFEGTFPGDWRVWDDNGSNYGEYYWGKRNCRPYAGNYSGWSVGGGAQGAALSCGNNYPHHTRSWMRYGPMDLRSVAAGELRFKMWLSTEPGDKLFWGISVDREIFYGYERTTSSGGWVEQVLNFTQVPTLTNVLGQSEVWVALAFLSDGSNTRAEGAYVDNIEVRVCYRNCPRGNETTSEAQGAHGTAIPAMQQPTTAPLFDDGREAPLVSPCAAPDPFPAVLLPKIASE